MDLSRMRLMRRDLRESVTIFSIFLSRLPENLPQQLRDRTEVSA